MDELLKAIAQLAGNGIYGVAIAAMLAGGYALKQILVVIKENTAVLQALRVLLEVNVAALHQGMNQIEQGQNTICNKIDTIEKRLLARPCQHGKPEQI